MSILDESLVYKPIMYQFALDAYMQQNSNHWTSKNIEMHNDLENFILKKSPVEKHILVNVLKSFVQSDIEVNKNYLVTLPRIFKNTHVRMMFSAFANIESMHVIAYDLLISSLPNLDDSIYQAFYQYKEIYDRFDFLDDFRRAETPEEIALTCAIFGAYTEGISLFSSFAILLYFSRQGEMGGVHHVLKYSISDESLHVCAMIEVYKTLCREFVNEIDQQRVNAKLINYGREVVDLEKQYINLIFSAGELPDMNKALMYGYLEYICDFRLQMLGLPPTYNTKNPLPWVEEEILTPSLTNFFDRKPTEYSINSKKLDNLTFDLGKHRKSS